MKRNDLCLRKLYTARDCISSDTFTWKYLRLFDQKIRGMTPDSSDPVIYPL